MNHTKKTAIDLLDDLYSLAYWMTGTEEETRQLVDRAYLTAADPLNEEQLLRSFRACYIERYGQETDFCISEPSCKPERNLMATLRQWAADIKLSVLLSEISGLRHKQIASIVGQPVETLRGWLFIGRKLLVGDMHLKASA